MRLDYFLLDPTGNITILVTSPVPVEKQAFAAARLMAREQNAEQVGFLSNAPSCDIALRMAGGEFCGNALLQRGRCGSGYPEPKSRSRPRYPF